MRAKIYHNPRCSKSREALALVRESGVEPEIVEYIKTPPSTAELAALVKSLGITPRDLLRRGEDAYKQLGLDAPDKTPEDILEAMAANPVLIERPIVITDKGVRLGRPPETVKEVL